MLYDPNEDKYRSWTYLFLIIIIITALALCSGCASRPATIDSDIVQYKTELSLAQERIGELEARNTRLQEGITRSYEIARSSGVRLEDIQRRADLCGDEITKLCFLFEQYEREVQRIITEICSNRTQTLDTSSD